MTLTVACEGQLTPVGVTVFNIFSGFLLQVFSISGPSACLQQKLNKDLQTRELEVSRNETR